MVLSNDLKAGYFYFLFYNDKPVVVEYCADYVKDNNGNNCVDRYFLPIWEYTYDEYEYVIGQSYISESVDPCDIIKEIGMYFDDKDDVQLLKNEFPEYFI